MRHLMNTLLQLLKDNNRFYKLIYRPLMIIALVWLWVLCQIVLPQQSKAHETLPFLGGVNLASGGFCFTCNPRRYGYEYIYASPSSVDYYHSKGFKLFRVPFVWESMQPTLFAPLSADELARLDELVNYITSKGLFVLIEAQNFARYSGQVLGEGVPIEALADLWKRLAEHYKPNTHILFDIMNEPHDMPTQVVFDMSQQSIDAIRSTGSENAILVEGNGWSAAMYWSTSGNKVLGSLQDPVNNLILAPHQYLDSDGSGTSPTCVNGNVGVNRISSITTWARNRQIKLFLGEFAGGANSVCQAAVTSMLTYMRDNSDVWVGWSWWAGGPWWGEYFFTLEPNDNGVERPQVEWLLPFLSAAES